MVTILLNMFRNSSISIILGRNRKSLKPSNADAEHDMEEELVTEPKKKKRKVYSSCYSATIHKSWDSVSLISCEIF